MFEIKFRPYFSLNHVNWQIMPDTKIKKLTQLISLMDVLTMAQDQSDNFVRLRHTSYYIAREHGTCLANRRLPSNVVSMLARVYDVGPTLTQHLINSSCLLGVYQTWLSGSRCSMRIERYKDRIIRKHQLCAVMMSQAFKFKRGVLAEMLSSALTVPMQLVAYN